MTSSSDAPAASSTVSMLLKVCSVCSARSSLTTLPVFGSKPPWPDRKIHSPTVSPGEYGPGGAGTLSELMRAFMDGGLLRLKGCDPVICESDVGHDESGGRWSLLPSPDPT